MDRDETVRLISGTPLFSGLDPEGLELLAEKAGASSFGKGQTIFLETDIGGALFIVAQGQVKVSVTSPEGAELILTTLRPPDAFGELPLIDGGPRSASATAMVPTTLLRLDRSTLLDVIGRRPDHLDGLLRSLGGVLRRLTEQAGDLAFLDLHGRVAKLLVRLAEEQGGRPDEPVILDLAMTQSDLADMVGGSRQSVNQILHSFARRGFIELRGREIQVVSARGLSRRAGIPPDARLLPLPGVGIRTPPVSHS
jgi:CRP/FNR family transcriptional regulator, cyclic AMP receptor protein